MRVFFSFVKNSVKCLGRSSFFFDSIRKIRKPIVAAVSGFALGGGCELAMACDIRIASTKARFGQPEIKLGIIPGGGGTQRLPRLIGTGPALKMLLTGEAISADEARLLGGQRAEALEGIGARRGGRTREHGEGEPAGAGHGRDEHAHDFGGALVSRAVQRRAARVGLEVGI